MFSFLLRIWLSKKSLTLLEEHNHICLKLIFLRLILKLLLYCQQTNKTKDLVEVLFQNCPTIVARYYFVAINFILLKIASYIITIFSVG